jgi:HK97 family phage portal protein
LGIFSYFFKRNVPVTDEKAWNPSLWRLLGSQSTSGADVTEYTALNYSAVFNAISLLSGTLASLPLHLLLRVGDRKKHAVTHPLYSILHDTANPYMTAMAVRECLVSHILAWGNGYDEVVRNELGEVVEIWPITPNRVTPRMIGGSLVYDITVDGVVVRLPRERVLHVPGLGFDGFVGYSVISLARQSIGLGMAMETFGSKYFGAGTHPGVVVSHPGKLSEAGSKNLRDSLATTYSGLGNSHRLMLLEEGMSLEKLGIPPNDSQFLESRQFQVPEIARWFNVPPHKLKDLTKSSFSNIESEQTSFVTDSLLPWGIRLEQNYNMQLLTPSERAQGLYFKHIFEGLLRGNAADRAEFYRKMFSIGAMNINEIREKEDLDPVEGGDVHLVPLNMTTLENAGKVQDDGKNEQGDPVPEKTAPSASLPRIQ